MTRCPFFDAVPFFWQKSQILFQRFLFLTQIGNFVPKMPFFTRCLFLARCLFGQKFQKVPSKKIGGVSNVFYVVPHVNKTPMCFIKNAKKVKKTRPQSVNIYVHLLHPKKQIFFKGFKYIKIIKIEQLELMIWRF